MQYVVPVGLIESSDEDELCRGSVYTECLSTENKEGPEAEICVCAFREM